MGHTVNRYRGRKIVSDLGTIRAKKMLNGKVIAHKLAMYTGYQDYIDGIEDVLEPDDEEGDITQE